jgi:hypothetical protein
LKSQDVSDLQNKGIVFLAVAIVALLAVSPLLQRVSIAPRTDFFTELYIYGPSHNATYPYNIAATEEHLLYVDVVNNQGENAQYMLQMKFRSQDQPGPGAFNKTSSSQPALESSTFSVADGKLYEVAMDVSFEYAIDPANDQLDMESVTMNGETYSLHGTTLNYDPSKYGFFGNLYFELYIYNTTVNAWQYDDRFVSLWLKMNA